MKQISIKPKPFSLAQIKALKGKKPSKGDCTQQIKEDCLIHIPGNMCLLYKKIDFDEAKTVQALKGIKFNYHHRTGGLASRSELIGYKVRNSKRNDVCDVAALSINYPKEHEHFMELSLMVAEVYKQNLSEYYNLNMELLNEKKILAEYKIANTPFTSGIVNYNNQLNYHRDTGNIETMLSCMLVLKNSVSGGFLSMPELDVEIECSNKTVVIFAGQDLIHGVTPIQYNNPKGYRYSFVYYAMDKIWDCKYLNEELLRYQNKLDKKSNSNETNND